MCTPGSSLTWPAYKWKNRRLNCVDCRLTLLKRCLLQIRALNNILRSSSIKPVHLFAGLPVLSFTVFLPRDAL